VFVPFLGIGEYIKEKNGDLIGERRNLWRILGFWFVEIDWHVVGITWRKSTSRKVSPLNIDLEINNGR
jgi:hypothetical protein